MVPPVLLLVLRLTCAAALRQQHGSVGSHTIVGGGFSPWPLDGELRLPCGGQRPCEGTADGVLHAMRAQLSEDLVRQVLDSAPVRYQVAACNECKTVTLWGPVGPRRKLRGHISKVAGVQFFPLGDRALTWSRDGAAMIWDTDSGQTLRRHSHKAPVSCGRVFPRGDRVVTCSEDGVCAFWAPAPGKVLRVAGGGSVTGVEVFPQGDRVLSWGAQAVALVRDAATGEQTCRFRGHSSQINIAKVFPQGDKVITGSDDGRAIIWDAVRCGALHVLEHARRVTEVAALGGGDTVATIGIEQGVAIWSVSSGKRLRTLVAKSHWLIDLFSGIEPFPQGDLLATYNVEAVVVWNVTSGAVLQRFANTSDWTYGVVVSPGGDLLAKWGSSSVTVWDVWSGAKLQTLAESSSMCFIAIGLSASLDPSGFGRGLSWRELP